MNQNPEHRGKTRGKQGDSAAKKLQSQDEVKQSMHDQLNLSDIYQAISAGIVVQDSNGTVTQVNDAACAILDTTRQDIIGKAADSPLWNIVGEDGSPLSTEEHPASIVLRTRQPISNMIIGLKHDSDVVFRWVQISSKPMLNEASDLVHVVSTFVDVTDRKRAENAFEAVLRATSSSVGEDFFICLVLELAEVLGTRYAFIGELIPETNRVRVLACSVDGEIVDNFEYDLSGTPCGHVVGRNSCFYPSSVQWLFPKVSLLCEMRAESYLGVPVSSSRGTPLGVIAVIDDKPMPETGLAKSILTIFADRAGAEIERLRTERQLKNAEEDYRLIFENAAIGMYQTTPDGAVIRVNQACAEMLGYASPDELKESVTNVASDLYLHPERRIEYVNAALSSDGFVRFENEYRRPDGTILIAYLHMRAVRDEDGNVIRLECFIEDITERKETEEALRDSERRLTDIINFLPDATFAIDLEGKVIAWNKAMENMTGVAAGDIIGKGDHEYSVAFYRTKRPMLIDLVIHPAPEETEYYSMFRREGMTIVAETYNPILNQYHWGIATALYDSDGNLVGAIESVRDVTQRKKAEIELRESEERYRGIIETAYEGIWILDTQMKTVYVNERMAQMLGYIVDEMLGRPVYDFIAPEFKSDMEDRLRRRFQGIKEWYDSKLKRKDGSEIWVIISVSPIRDSEGKIINTFAMVTDITDRKNMEQQLRLTQFSVDHASDAVFWVDENGELVYVNEKAANSLGYTQNELLSMTVFQIDSKANREVWRRRWKEWEQGGTFVIQTRQQRKDGTALDVELSVKLLEYAGTKLAFAFARDITDRIRAEEERRESERRIQEILDSAPFGSLAYTLQDGELILTGINQSAERILGISRDDFIGLTILEAFPALTQTDLPEAYKAVALGGESFERREFHYKANNLEGTFQIFAFQTAPNRMAILFRDVTEQRRAEEAKRKFEKSVEAQKRQFYRDTILSVTGGKLEISDFAVIKRYLRLASTQMKIFNTTDIPEARRITSVFLEEKGIVNDRLHDFMTGVGEALTNAIKHGKRGTVYLGEEDGSAWVAVADMGPGIESIILPQAVLRTGYSTKPSMGFGYSIILSVSDHVLLQTSKRGTIVIMFKNVMEKKEKFSLDNLPDVWDAIPDLD